MEPTNLLLGFLVSITLSYVLDVQRQNTALAAQVTALSAQVTRLANEPCRAPR